MVKLKDIARETGLTVSTVSKALNNCHEISEATTERVVAAAEALGYRLKRSGIKQETRIIGAILPEVRSHFYAELMHALSTEADRHGYMLITVLTNAFMEDMTPYVERLLRQNVEGLFLNGVAGLPPVAWKLLRDNGVPTVVLRDSTRGDLCGIDSISINGTAGIWLAVEHLVELGHRKIGFLGESLSVMRCEAFREAMKQYGLEVEPAYIKKGSERFEYGGYLRALELLREPELPTAVLTSYDQIAYGATRAFLEHGIRVPEDISIVGYDTVTQAEHYPVPLTSVSKPVEHMGIAAVNTLMDAIRSPETHVPRSIAMQGQLVVRASTCPPRPESKTERPEIRNP